MSRRKRRKWTPPSDESLARLVIENPEMRQQGTDMEAYLHACRALRHRFLKSHPKMDTDTLLYADMMLAAESLALVYLKSNAQQEVDFLVDTQFRRLFEQCLYMLRQREAPSQGVT